MTHGEKLARINASFDVLKEHKPKWYRGEERRLDNYDRYLEKKAARASKTKTPFQLKPKEPPGIAAAERGR